MKVTEEYRLLKVVGGICHFARVRVSAEPHDVLDVIERLTDTPSHGDGEVNRRLEPEWVEAALQGCREGASYIAARGQFPHVRLTLERIVGLTVDTRPADVFLAAFIATCQAIQPDFQPPPFEFLDGQWVMKSSQTEGT